MSWLSVCASEAPELEHKLAESVRLKVQAGKFEQRDIEYLARLKRPLVDGTLAISDQRLEMLRRLCQLWEVDIKQGKITSHRKIVGPLIVAFKRALFPLLRVLLRDFIKQQRDFNSAAISLLADLSREESGRGGAK